MTTQKNVHETWTSLPKRVEFAIIAPDRVRFGQGALSADPSTVKYASRLHLVPSTTEAGAGAEYWLLANTLSDAVRVPRASIPLLEKAARSYYHAKFPIRVAVDLGPWEQLAALIQAGSSTIFASERATNSLCVSIAAEINKVIAATPLLKAEIETYFIGHRLAAAWTISQGQ